MSVKLFSNLILYTKAEIDALLADVGGGHAAVSIGAGGLSAKLQIAVGQVLTLLGIDHSDLSGIGADDHHDQQHSITSASDHTFPGGTTNFLREDGSWSEPPGGSSGPDSVARRRSWMGL